MSDEVQVRDERRVRWIILNRPQSKNGLTIGVNERLIAALRGAAEEREVRAVALFGAGGSFCSGLDLKAAAADGPMDPAQREPMMREYFHGLIRAVRAVSKPVVAVVDGHAVGFGCDLALACDVRLVSDRARFGELFVRRGLMPDGGASWTLPRLVGLGRALELMLTGDIVDATEAYRIGMANRIIASAELEAAAQTYCERLAAGAPLVHKAVKESVYAAMDTDLEAALENEVRQQMKLLQSTDFMEGVTAFLMKRDPVFKGE